MSRGNQARTARLLGISRDVLHYRMKKLNSSGHCVICPTSWVISPIETQLNFSKTLSHRISKFPPLPHKVLKLIKIYYGWPMKKVMHPIFSLNGTSIALEENNDSTRCQRHWKNSRFKADKGGKGKWK